MDLEAALRETEAALDAARVRQRLANEEVEALEMEHKGLTLAVARRRGLHPPPVVSESEQESGLALNWEALTRTAAVETMLGRQDQFVGPADLSRLLVAAGRKNDTPNYVAATLEHLKQRNRAVRVGYGKWKLADDNKLELADDAQPNGSEPAADTEVRRYVPSDLSQASEVATKTGRLLKN
jgi:hypothetical protein